MTTQGITAFLQLSLYRQSEGECCAAYFSQWFAKYKDNIIDGSVIILVDELENSNDSVTVNMIMDTFRNWCEHNKQLQILITTHSPIVLSHADKVIELKKGYAYEMKKLYRDALQRIKG